jgi:hypothetical protein
MIEEKQQHPREESKGIEQEQENNEEEEEIELKEGMMVIIPYWGWSDIDGQDKFCTAKLVGFATIGEEKNKSESL